MILWAFAIIGWLAFFLACMALKQQQRYYNILAKWFYEPVKKPIGGIHAQTQPQQKDDEGASQCLSGH